MTILNVHNEFENGSKMGHFPKFFIFITSTAVNLLQQTLPRLSPGEFHNQFKSVQEILRFPFYNSQMYSLYYLDKVIIEAL